MAKFLTVNEAYRVIQRELPEDVYADGSPSGFFTTADSYSIAKTLETLYSNLARIEANNWPQTADEKIQDWAKKVFGFSLPSSLSLIEKQDRIIAKIRKQPNVTLWEVLTLIASFLPEGKYVQIYKACLGSASWELGVSLLGYDTFLRGITFDSLGTSTEEWCSFVAGLHWRLGQDALGETTFLSEFLFTDIVSIQADAYLYQIRIFDYTFSDMDLVALEKEINAAEPARAGHKITQGLNLNDFGLTTIVPNVNQFSLVDCITRDPLSTTGFTGRTT